MRAVIYTRVSNDDSGRSRSTEDQERECRALCETHGWSVAEVLCDNDIGASRWSGKDRPAYRQLTKVLRKGDVLVTWEASRAQRDLEAYVQLRDLCAQRGVQWCYSGRIYDLSDGDDRFSTGLDALMAEKEAEQLRTRVLRGKRAAALAGRPNGFPPYGYRIVRDPVSGRTLTWELDPEPAMVIEEVSQRVLGGESLFAIARELTMRKVPAPTKTGEWLPRRMRLMLLTPSYAGLRVHQGKVIGKGVWPALITEEEHLQLTAILTDPSRVTSSSSATKHLLTGIARCGVCGSVVRYFGPKSLKTPTYQCEANSCVRRRTDLVDELVVENLLARLEALDPDDIDTTNVDAVEAMREARQLRARLEAFADQAADGALTAASLARVEAKLLPQIAAAERRASVSQHPIIGHMAGPDARSTWETLDILPRRELVRVMMTVTINKSTVGTRRFSPADVPIAWK
ncbi:recombinase family protein [Williamsia soli]|uniref:recombinase family protein n=1 Tax=Williamsia soli TaxID=364929 RepID=UPI001A9CF05F|nr:recombinase family protein [Williamsia soli]